MNHSTLPRAAMTLGARAVKVADPTPKAKTTSALGKPSNPKFG